jgi:Cobalamin-independent synthase, Catalytic domain
MLETTIAGSLPKPAWLAQPRMLWAPWRLEGEALVEAKRDATLLALKEQEEAGIDIVTDGEQARHHFVHGFLQQIEGIDFGRRVTMGIRNNRYNAEVPTVTGPLRRVRSVHRFEAEMARTHTRRRLKFTLPGPMTIVDTIADDHYRDKVALAMAFAALLNEEAHELAAIGVDVVQFDEPAFNVYMKEVTEWGIAALHRAAEGLRCKTAVHICYGYGIKANIDWKADPRHPMATVRGDLPGVGGEPDRSGIGRVRRRQSAGRVARSAAWEGHSPRCDRCRYRARRDTRGGRIDDRTGGAFCPGRAALSVHQLRHGADGSLTRNQETGCARRRGRAGSQPAWIKRPVNARRTAGQTPRRRSAPASGSF